MLLHFCLFVRLFFSTGCMSQAILYDVRFASLFFILCLACLALYITLSNYLSNTGDTVFFDGSLPMNTKYILLWNAKNFWPFSLLDNGQKAFIVHNCSKTNCFVTSNRNFFKDLTRFDAIAFNGRFLKELYNDLPKKRSAHQKYIYFNMESADSFPVCDDKFDGFFNFTATYRLDSDIVQSYILIRDIEGEIVGPKVEMVWKEDMGRVNDEFSNCKIVNKTKAAAWLVSNCLTLSRREEFVKKLQRALKPYDLSVDVYGTCGRYKCPRENYAECHAMLERDYYFYLSLENSFADDYVTEKVLTALQHNTVPVVFGGAHYSRFLPPGSYLDGRSQTPRQLALSMASIIWSSNLYKNYFKWRNHYSYHDATSENICGVCAALSRDMVPHVYDKFRAWWNPNFKERCSNKY